MKRLCSPGFTLIEMLVVISLIAVLVGLLLPALGAARKATRASVCMSNQRQMGIGLYSYSLDFEDCLPSVGLGHAGAAVDQGSWLFAMSDYIQTEEVYKCLSDESPQWDTPSTRTGRLRRVSYATNYLVADKYPGFLQPGSSGLNPYSKLSKIARPYDTIYAVELTQSDDNGFATADHVHPEGWLFLDDEQISLQVAIEQHFEKANYLFFDGHVSSYSRTETFFVGSDFFSPEINKYDPR